MDSVFRKVQPKERKHKPLDHVKTEGELSTFMEDMEKSMKVYQKYLENVPENIHQSLEECCRDKILPGINDYTHNEMTSMYYHIQTNMSDEYKKQTKKLEQLVELKMDQSHEAFQNVLNETMDEFVKEMREEQEKNKKMLFLNTVISIGSFLVAIVCVICFIILQF